MRNPDNPNPSNENRKFKPLNELSPLARRIILSGLEEDWPQMTYEDRVNYLRAGGLESCQAVGIEVPLEMLKEAGLA